MDESCKNTCGLKISAGGEDTDKNAHKKVNSWDEGIRSHMDHLALYTEASGYPKTNTYDQRQFVKIKGKRNTVNSLGRNCAPGVTYG